MKYLLGKEADKTVLLRDPKTGPTLSDTKANEHGQQRLLLIQVAARAETPPCCKISAKFTSPSGTQLHCASVGRVHQQGTPSATGDTGAATELVTAATASAAATAAALIAAGAATAAAATAVS
jgi:hypothetical protein